MTRQIRLNVAHVVTYNAKDESSLGVSVGDMLTIGESFGRCLKTELIETMTDGGTLHHATFLYDAMTLF